MRSLFPFLHALPRAIGKRRFIAFGVRSFVATAVLGFVAGCGGGGGGMHVAPLPVVQGPPTASEMNATYPQSVSPASFKVAPMPQTQRLPASALPDALRGITPQSIESLHYSKLSGSAVSVAGAPDGSL